MRRPLPVLAVAVAVLTAGCAQIPRSGAVVEGSRVDAPADSRGLEPVAVGPAPGASPTGIVTGLVEAMVSSADEYAVARSFLDHDRADDWQPRRETVVFGGTPRISLTGSGDSRRGTLQVQVVATVEADGRYRRVEPYRRQVPITLVRDREGQWRASQFPDLTLISTDDFSFCFRVHPIDLLGQDGSVLVPVQRYLPGSDGLAARLAAAVLAGAPVADRAGYAHAVPRGTALASPATVTTDGSTAVVALTEQARGASPDQRAQLHDQLLATLRGVLPITDVRLTVDGGDLDVPDHTPLAEVPAATDLPILLHDGRLQHFDGERLTTVTGLPQIPSSWEDEVAQAGGDSRFAVTTRGGTRLYLLMTGRPLGRPVVSGVSLTQPSFDRQGWVYTSASPSPGTLDAVSTSGVRHRLQARWLAGRMVRSLRISPDGGFAAVVSAASPRGHGRLDVVPVIRRAGVPVGLAWAASDTRSLLDEDLRTAAWRSSTELAVATTTGPAVLQVDGPLVSSGQTRDVGEFAPGLGSGMGDLSLTTGGRLFQYSGGGWYRVGGVTRVHSIAATG